MKCILISFLASLALLASPSMAQNQALRVDGFGHLLVPKDVSLEPDQALTVECWVKSEGSNSHGRIVRKEERSSGYHLSWSFQKSQVSALIVCGTGDVAYDPSSNSSYLGEWHHLAMTARRGPGGEVRLFVDGILVASAPVHECLGHHGDLAIGDRPGGGEGFIGLIDVVRIWSVERTEEQIRSNMHRRIATGPGLISAWQLDGDGQDSVGGNHGSLVGDATLVPADTPIDSFELSPPRGDFRGGFSAIIQSHEFPPFDDSLQVFFGDQEAPVTIIDEDTLSATVPPASEPGAHVPVYVRMTGFESFSPEGFVYTPRLEADLEPPTGGFLEGRILITRPSAVFGFMGSPPAVDLPVRSYGATLNIFPLYPVFYGTYVFQNEVPFSVPIPDRPDLIGRSFLIQCLGGPALDGVNASFSNSLTITLR